MAQIKQWDWKREKLRNGTESSGDPFQRGKQEYLLRFSTILKGFPGNLLSYLIFWSNGKCPWFLGTHAPTSPSELNPTLTKGYKPNHEDSLGLAHMSPYWVGVATISSLFSDTLGSLSVAALLFLASGLSFALFSLLICLASNATRSHESCYMTLCTK